MSKWYSDTTQIAWVCAMLCNGKEISHACEFEAVKGWRLSAVVEKLRKQYGWPIDTEFRGKNRIGFYKLRPDTDTSKLKKPKSYLDYLEKQGLLEKKKKGARTPSSKSDSNNPKSDNTDK